MRRNEILGLLVVAACLAWPCSAQAESSIVVGQGGWWEVRQQVPQMQRSGWILGWSENGRGFYGLTYSGAREFKSRIFDQNKSAFLLDNAAEMEVEQGQRLKMEFPLTETSETWWLHGVLLYQDLSRYRITYNEAERNIGHSSYSGAPILTVEQKPFLGVGVAYAPGFQIWFLRLEFHMDLVAGYSPSELISIEGIEVTQEDRDAYADKLRVPIDTSQTFGIHLLGVF